MKSKVITIPATNEQHVELYECYGASHVHVHEQDTIKDEKIVIYKQYMSAARILKEAYSFLKIRDNVEDAAKDTIYRLQDKIKQYEDLISRCKKLIKKVEDKQYEVKELEDSV